MKIESIAYIGLGIMGRGMVTNLLKAGYDVTVYNRTIERAEPFAEQGATVARSIADAVRGKDLVMYCLSNDHAVEDVVWGDGGLASSLESGQIAVDMSTVHPDTSRREHAAFAENAVSFLDAPVFGSKNEAMQGGLWIIVGGERGVFGRIEPALDALSETVHYMGGPGMGTSMKLVGNLVVAMQLEALGEAMLLATKAGLDLRAVLDVLHVTDFKSPIFDGVGPALIARDFSTSFPLKHMLKDADLIARFAQDLKSPIPAIAVVRETIKGAINQGWGEENASAFIKMLEIQAGTEVKE